MTQPANAQWPSIYPPMRPMPPPRPSYPPVQWPTPPQRLMPPQWPNYPPVQWTPTPPKRPSRRPLIVAIAIIVAVISMGVVSAIIIIPVLNSRTTVASAVRNAVSVTNTYWSTHWTQFFPNSGAYRSPTLFGTDSGLYDSRTAGPVPSTCTSSQPGGNDTTDNAGYCSLNDTLAWDTVFMERAERSGTEIIYLTVAHEWGHAIQQRRTPYYNSELTADCLSGATVYGAARDGLITLQPTSQQNFENSLSGFGDPTPAVSPHDHGTASQRISSFNQGRNGGVNSCLGD